MLFLVVNLLDHQHFGDRFGVDQFVLVELHLIYIVDSTVAMVVNLIVVVDLNVLDLNVLDLIVVDLIVVDLIVDYLRFDFDLLDLCCFYSLFVSFSRFSTNVAMSSTDVAKRWLVVLLQAVYRAANRTKHRRHHFRQKQLACRVGRRLLRCR